MPSRDDVIHALEARHAGNRIDELLSVLDRYGTLPHEGEKERVQLAIIALAGADAERIPMFVEAAKVDYRDVLQWHDGGPLSPAEGEALVAQVREVIGRWGRKLD